MSNMSSQTPAGAATRLLSRLESCALSTRETLYNSYDLAHWAPAGSFVECGVYSGAQCAAMALASPGRRVHLFDSFVGIPESGPMDDESINTLVRGGDRLVTTGISACSAALVKMRMREWGVQAQLVFHEGWFQNTVPPAARVMHESYERIAILRLDGDLYESTKVCMHHLAPLVVPGGFIIIDDWALTGCRKACEEWFKAHDLVGDRRPDIQIVENSTPAWWRVSTH